MFVYNKCIYGLFISGVSLVKELRVIHCIYVERCENGKTKQKGKWVYQNELKGHESTLRRKKPLMKLLAYDPELLVVIEKKFKYSKVKVGYMGSDFKAEVLKKIKGLIQAGKEPKNPIFYGMYVDVFGDQQDKQILGELLAKKDDEKEDKD